MSTSSSSPPTGLGRRSGVVVDFDEHVGLGTVAPVGGGAGWGFHCTQLADGTRVVAPGAEVDFEVRPAHGGREEAFDLRRR